MRKDHLITNLIGISFFSFIAALVLAIVFAAIRGIIGVVVLRHRHVCIHSLRKDLRGQLYNG